MEHVLTIHLDDNTSESTTNGEGKIKASKLNNNDKAKQAEELSNSTLGGGKDAQGSSQKRADRLKSFGSGTAGALAISSAKTIARNVSSVYISSIGTKYANQARQNEIQNAMSVAGNLGTIIGATVAGSSVGPAGALVGAVAATASVGVQMYQQGQNWAIEQQETTRESTRAQERLGIVTSSKNR